MLNFTMQTLIQGGHKNERRKKRNWTYCKKIREYA